MKLYDLLNPHELHKVRKNTEVTNSDFYDLSLNDLEILFDYIFIDPETFAVLGGKNPQKSEKILIVISELSIRILRNQNYETKI